MTSLALLSEAILSGQVPDHEVPALCKEHPGLGWVLEGRSRRPPIARDGQTGRGACASPTQRAPRSVDQDNPSAENPAQSETIDACSIEGCFNPVRTRGWCSAHYQRWRRMGDPLAGRPMQGETKAFIEKVLTSNADHCIDWPFAKNSHGRGLVWLDGTMRMVARVVCERAHGAPPTQKHEAAHSCGKGHEGCINPRHLRWATPAENQADRVLHGTHARGERCPTSKLKESEVLDIRRRAAAGESQTSLAVEFGVNHQTVSRVVRRERWGWLA